MAKRRRDSKGRFLPKRKGRSRSRKNPARNMKRDALGRFVGKKGGRSRSRSRRRTRRNPGRYSSNPATGDFVGSLAEAGMGAVGIVAGKAASRSIPGMVGLPNQGNVGVAVRVGVGVGLGFVADMAGFAATGGRLVEGAMVGAIEDLAVAYNVPWLGASLSRTPGLSSYPTGPRLHRGRGSGGGRGSRRRLASYPTDAGSQMLGRGQVISR